MGDFLGATICMTELIILCTIHAFPFARNLRDIITKGILKLWSEWRTYGKINLASLSAGVVKNTDQIITNPLFRLIIVLGCVYLWSYWMNLIRLMKISRNGDVNDNNCNSEDASRITETSFSERYEEAREYIDSLAKPVGSLGTLEKYAAR